MKTKAILAAFAAVMAMAANADGHYWSLDLAKEPTFGAYGSEADWWDWSGAEVKRVGDALEIRNVDDNASVTPDEIARDLLGLSASALGAEGSFDARAGESAYQPQVGVRVGGFWGEKYKTLVTKWIPHCIRQMEKGGEGEELMNLVAAGDKLRGEKPRRSFKGCKWSDAYPYNIIEAASLALELDPGDDAELKAGQDFLRKKIEEWIPVILAAQEESGYIDSYTCLHNMPHFRKAADHEFYVMGYFIEMGIAHHRATGDRRLIDAAIRCADHIDSVFGPAPKRTWMNGHPGLEYALCRLTDATGDEKYARLAQFFIRNQHTCRENHSAYNQAERPAADMSEAKGHAVRANYFYAAMAAVANRLGDKPLGEAAKRLFDSIVDRKMYLTGGIGADYAREAYGEDYDLPQDAYGESCAGCGLEFFARKARRLVGSDKAEAVRERVIYNNILGAISRDGDKFYYQNPLSSNRPRTSWHGCPCCVGNVPRTLLALKDTIFSVEGDTLYVNQYMDIENAKVTIGGKEYLVSLITDYPAEGKVSLCASFPADIKVFARFPNRAESALYKVEPEVEHGYKEIPQSPWCGMSSWELPLLEQKVTADERVESCRGRVACQRGPIVYSWENGKKVPNYDRLNNGGYSEVWRAVGAQAAPKPLLPGFHPDPSVCVGHDGAYYLTTSTFMWRPGLPIYRSEDFRDWSLVGHAIADFADVTLEEDIGLNDDDGVWAPTIRYNDGTYYLVFTFHGKKSRNYLTTAKDPAGPWTTPVHIKEADGGIDPSLFFDDDGKCYWTANTTARPQEWKSQTAIYVQEIDLAAGKLVGERKVISNGALPQAKYAEGPHLYKIQGEYVLIQAEGGTDFEHAATAMKSKSVWGPYKPTRYNPLVTRRDRGKNSPLQATGHADLVKVPNAGKAVHYAVFLGKRPIGEDGRVILGRETFACPALWRDGDLIFQDERLIAGEVVTPEEECETVLPGAKIHRVRDFKFDETIDAKDGEAMILYRSADGNITLDGPGTLRMKSDDGITVKCYRNDELVKEVSTAELMKHHTRFNGLGIGKIYAPEDDGHTATYSKGRIDVPVKRNDGHTEHYMNRHNSILSKIKHNESHHFDLVFVGDSITHNWGRDGWKRDVYGAKVFEEEFGGLKTLNCGFGGDRVETLHWRLANGELDGYTADFFCVLIGTNNRQNSSEEISGGVKALVRLIEAKHPEAKIVLMTILPRNDIHPPKVTEEIIARVRGANPLIEAWAKEDPKIILLNLDAQYQNADGSLKAELFNDGIHPNAAGYRIWAAALKDIMGRGARTERPL